MGVARTYVEVNAPVYVDTGTTENRVWEDSSHVITEWKYSPKRTSLDISTFDSETKKSQAGRLEISVTATLLLKQDDSIVQFVSNKFFEGQTIGLKFPMVATTSYGDYTIMGIEPVGGHGDVAKFALTFELAGDLTRV